MQNLSKRSALNGTIQKFQREADFVQIMVERAILIIGGRLVKSHFRIKRVTYSCNISDCFADNH